MTKLCLRILSGSLVTLLFCATLYALDTDSTEPLSISANSADLNRKTGVGTYRGNVKVTQGSTIVTGDVLITYMNDQRKLNKAVVKGNTTTRAHYQTVPKPDESTLHARANKITYFPQKRLVILEGDAEILQNGNSFKAPYITYNLNTQHIISKNSPDKQQRTTIMIRQTKQVLKQSL
ncbi:MAG: hypothetical protein Tsb005_06510 [Gammaproteobacteria bacterium]